MTSSTGIAIEKALAQIDEWVAADAVPAASAAVWHRGQIVARRVAGEAQPGVPADDRTIFALASVTKPMTATTVVSLAEEGVIGLDEPIVRWVPEFAEPGPFEDADLLPLQRFREQVTVRQLLAHTSGLPEDSGPGPLRYAAKAELDTMIDQLGELPLKNEPGSELRYSNAGYALLGRLVERATGNGFWDEVGARVLQPIRMDDTAGRPDESWYDRIALVRDAPMAGTDTESYNSAYWRGLGIPWGGAYGTPSDLVRFAGAFLEQGGPLLSATSALRMVTDQAGGIPGGVVSMRVRWPVAWWGLGWELKGGKGKHWFGDLSSPRTFGHFGASGTLLLADPDHQVALAVFGSRTTQHLWPFVGGRWSKLVNGMIEAVS